MESSWLRTMQLIGLDIMLMAIVALFALNAVEPIFRRWREAAQSRRSMPGAPRSPEVLESEAGMASPQEVDALLRFPTPDWLAGTLRGMPVLNARSTENPADERRDSDGRRVA